MECGCSVVPLSLCPASLSASLSLLLAHLRPIPSRSYRVDLMMVLAQHHPSKCHRYPTPRAAHTRRLPCSTPGWVLAAQFLRLASDTRVPLRSPQPPSLQRPDQGVSARSERIPLELPVPSVRPAAVCYSPAVVHSRPSSQAGGMEEACPPLPRPTTESWI